MTTVTGDNEIVLKIVILGQKNAGKTIFLMRYIDTMYSINNKNTIGVEFHFKSLTIDNRQIKLQIWDAAIQERFHSITSRYYRGVNCCLLCFDVNDEKSFERLDYWRNELLKNQTIYTDANDNEINIPIVLIGNKIDVVGDNQSSGRVVSKERAEEWCKNNGNIIYLETSAKLAINVDETFLIAAKKALEYHDFINHIDHPYRFSLSNPKTIPTRSYCYTYYC